MITDEERREVARKLREYVDLPDDWWADTYSGFYVEKCAFGNVERHRESELFARLADLIEPPLQCPHYHSDIHYCSIHEDIQPIDRDALIVLARNLDLLALMVNSHELTDAGQIAGTCQNIANGIREALGMQE